MITDYVDHPNAFVVADAADAYPKLGILSDHETAAWTRARRQAIASAPELVTIDDQGELLGFAVVRTSDADSRALGMPIATLDAIGVRAGDPNTELGRVAQILRAARSTTNAHLVTALVELGQSVIVDGMQRAGARVQGVNNTWIRPLDPGAVDGPATVVGGDELLDAARLAFSDYRGHYHVDPRLADAHVTSVYVEAVRRHLASSGETWVERDAEGVIGFATLEPHTTVNEVLERVGVVEIGFAGIVPRARGSGAFRRVLAGALGRCSTLGFRHVYYGCGASNIGAQSALLADGRFRLRRCNLRFHWWLDE